MTAATPAKVRDGLPDPNSPYERACAETLEDLAQKVHDWRTGMPDYPASWQLGDMRKDISWVLDAPVEDVVREFVLRHGDPFEESDPDAAYDAHRDREVGLDD